MFCLRRSAMSERNGLRYGLLGLALLILLALLALVINRSDSSPTAAPAAESTHIESLAALGDQPPSRRDLNMTFAAGSSHDDGVPGLAMLTNAMLNEGVPGKDVGAIAAGFENLGANFGNGAFRDMAIASLRSLSAADKREPAMQLFNQVLGQPTFPDDALARIKNQLLAGFEYQKQNPGKLASLALFERLYGMHPYAHSSDGNAESIPIISREQLQAFHSKAYTANNAIIALVGDLSRSDAEALASQVSAALPKGPALPRIAQPEEPKPGLQHIEFPSNQTHLMIAQLGIDRRDPDYAALYLANQVFGGGGFGTRLMTEVREKRGLTYGVYSGFSAMQARGP